MKYIRRKDILTIHKELEKLYQLDSSILLQSNLELALETPKRKIFGTEIYRTLNEKAAALMYNLIKLHPFIDGNKRTALLATILFLDQNDRKFKRNTNEEVETTLETSKCNTDVEQLTDWIKNNSKRKT